MIDAVNKELVNEFRDWALEQVNPEYTLKAEHGKYEAVTAETRFAKASAIFHVIDGLDVVEMSVINKTTQSASFYLHFELKDLLHAEQLFEEMISTLMKTQGTTTIKVLLCCSSALTTSFFKEKLNSAAELLTLDMMFDAISYNSLFTEGYDANVILLAPQIGYELKKVKEIMKDKLVLMAPAQIFASYDVSGMIDFVNRKLAENEQQKREKMLPAERMEFKNTPCMLVIAVIVEFESIRFVYRVYDAGSIIIQDEVIKQKFEIIDLEDMLDYELNRYPNVQMVCVNSPGVFVNGHMTFKSAGIFDVDIQTRFEQKYNKRFIFSNDANSMALGFYGLQKKSKNLSFYFHPQAARTAGVGNVINGRLHTGAHNLSGEMQFVYQVLSYTKDPDELLKTPEGVMELAARYIISIIANMDPEEIVIYCNMLYDLNELKEYLGHFIYKEYLPELIKVDDVIEYMFIGGMMQCVEALSRDRLSKTANSYLKYVSEQN